MRVSIQKIAKEKEEEARLLVHELDDSVKNLKDYLEGEVFRAQVLTVQKEKEIVRIFCRDIYYIETVQDVLYLHTKKGIYTSKIRLYQLERKLPENFIRISRSAILNMDQVKEYRPVSGRLLLAVFENDDAVYVSRRYVKELRDYIKGEMK